MSFEGYYQLVCKNGHYYTAELYSTEEKTPCSLCGEKPVWWNLVDITNDDGNPVKLKLKKRKTCDKCHSTLEELYYIPKDK